MELNSYPSVYAIGHRAIADLLLGPVLVEEKVDGSQISFGKIHGELHIRSKGAVIYPDSPEGMFAKAVETIKSLNLQDGWVYRGEYLQKPKHNALAYDRVPRGHIVLFDVQYHGYQDQAYFAAEYKKQEAERLGLEAVPSFYYGTIESLEQLLGFLDTVSFLGGQKIEGVVVKNYNLYTVEKKIALGKFVSEAFKEVHAHDWKQSNPAQSDVLLQLVAHYKTPARWNKAVQHLTERGELQEAPQDIGPLLKEVSVDVLKECEDEIKDHLFKYFWPKLSRALGAGLPEWYKERLAGRAFDGS